MVHCIVQELTHDLTPNQNRGMIHNNKNYNTTKSETPLQYSSPLFLPSMAQSTHISINTSRDIEALFYCLSLLKNVYAKLCEYKHNIIPSTTPSLNTSKRKIYHWPTTPQCSPNPKRSNSLESVQIDWDTTPHSLSSSWRRCRNGRSGRRKLRFKS